VVGLLAATVLTLNSEVRMPEWDDWAYYYAIQNFSQGQFTVDTQTHSQQVAEAAGQGGRLNQYFEIRDGTWALEKAPGYVLYEIPFKLGGVPRAGNIVLALAVVVVTYLVLKRLRDEKTAMIGSLLVLFTPAALMSLNRAFMDTYASMAFLVIGGGLYIYYHLQRGRFKPLGNGLLLAGASFFIGWSVVTRYSNILIAVALALHFLIFLLIAWRNKKEINFISEVMPFLLGAGLSAAALLLYNYFVFGSPLDYGYNYSSHDARFTTKFAFQYLGQANQNGMSYPLQLILNNLRIWPYVLPIGFPLLLVGIPGVLLILYFKFKGLFKKGKPNGRWSSLQTEISWDILLVLISWFVFVFFLYMMYEFTATHGIMRGFISFDRYYLPGLFPLVIVSALVISRFPWKLYIPTIIIFTVFGALVYSQWAWNLHILPAWMFRNSVPGLGRFRN